MEAMILGRGVHPQSACFDEIDAAVRAMTDRVVCFNAHAFNLENFSQIKPEVLDRWADHEVWDFSARNAALYGAKHVPVGWHPSMERFERAPVQDIDVVFSGCINTRRMKVLEDLADRGLKVVVVPPGIYGAHRDGILARARLALNMLFYEDGVFPALRVAHLVANRVPVLSERCPEMWNWVSHTPYENLQWCASNAIAEGRAMADHAYSLFVQRPMVLPS